MHGPITIEQLDLAAKAPRTGCAPGLDQVTEAESLKLPELHAELLKVLNTVYVWHCAWRMALECFDPYSQERGLVHAN